MSASHSQDTTYIDLYTSMYIEMMKLDNDFFLGTARPKLLADFKTSFGGRRIQILECRQQADREDRCTNDNGRVHGASQDRMVYWRCFGWYCSCLK